ncbi:putative NADPH-dependent methylglyoxal reductase GRP2 [Candida viswanathii]|uniref:Putative NADPH-dependent methylglyoxal reductase GRP2 n=1 Tax=Candida viswanathii TaxID=5486 RepID=A0A367YPY0_9ASCO|nr:putative NADPH-dependent methylglyoxal reductase GRP2 [Candida viswanathii]
MTTTVFVSGASGFIAQELVKQLIQRNYKVVGSVRSQAKGENIQSNLRAANLPAANFQFEIVPDISLPGAFEEALRRHPEVTVFLHTASPFHFRAKDVENELLIPAINGTKNALTAIQAHAPQVKRVVVTSSVVAVGKYGKYASPDDKFNESSWNPIDYKTSKRNPFYGYFGSKTFAERAAWEYVKDNKPNFELSVVNPAMVLGPQAFPITTARELNTSSEEINALLKLKPGAKVNMLEGTFIDVRDVAKAHIVAFEKEESKGKRLLLVEEMYNGQGLLNVINKNFPELNLPKGDPSKAKMENPDKWNSDETKKILGFEYIGLEQSVVDSVKQILESRGTTSKL